jgi:hypothetical protein
VTSAQVLGGRLGAYRRWARTSDRTAATAPARAAFASRFEREVDPDGKLPAHERAQRADAARSAFYAELALKRHQGKRRKVA